MNSLFDHYRDDRDCSAKNLRAESPVEAASFRDFPSIRVGNAQSAEGWTGVTVVLCTNPLGAVGGVDVRGGAPGTRETDLLKPESTVQNINAVVLSGGSAFGLEAASGVMQFLEEKGIGFDVGVTRVPIVPSAILFDLAFGDFAVRPDKAMGYQACANAYNGISWKDGNVGAGAGATVGKVLGMSHAMKSGLGSFCLKVKDLYVGAIVAVNAFGDVFDPLPGKIVAGALNDDRKTFLNSEDFLGSGAFIPSAAVSNTSIGVVVTNAKLAKAQANRLAALSQDGYARTIRPVHTILDGDSVFAMATGEVDADMLVIGVLAVKAMERAVVNAVKNTWSLKGMPSYKEIGQQIG